MFSALASSFIHFLLKRTLAIKKASLTPRTLAKYVADFASDKKAEDTVILDMRKVANFCDYFVVSSGNTNRHVKAIAEGIGEGLDKLGIKVRHKHGLQDASWVIFDLGDIVIHIFEEDMRKFYQLEHLWAEAKEVKWNQKSPKP